MTDTTIALLPCINGCIRKGTEDTDHPEPLVAKRGMFCVRCFGKVERALRRVPALVQHIVANFPGSVTQTTDDVRVSGSAERALGAFSEQAWIDADVIYSTLAGYSAHWATAMEISPPAPARRSWRDEHGYVIGLPANETPSGARQTVGVLSDWLLIHLPQIFTYDQASVNDLIHAVEPFASIGSRWPMEEKPHKSPMPHVQNPNCGGEIKYWPAGAPGSDTYAACTKCGQRFDSDEYEDALFTYLVEVHAERLASNVKAHLMRKYGQRTALLS